MKLVLTMKEKENKGEIIIGTLVEYADGNIAVKGVKDGEVYEVTMKEETAERFGKCNAKDGTLVALFVVNDTVERFMFRGRFRGFVELPAKEGDEKTRIGEINVFIGRAARIFDGNRQVQVSVPVAVKDGTEWFTLAFWKGTDEAHPVDVGAKALLDLQAPEGEKKPNFWAVTYGPRKYKDKNDVERATYGVRGEDFGLVPYIE